MRAQNEAKSELSVTFSHTCRFPCPEVLTDRNPGEDHPARAYGTLRPCHLGFRSQIETQKSSRA